jgi:pimeloyl-ACP methyl ester carboxylesterase
LATSARKIGSIEQLQQFRAAHPLQRLAIGGAEWQYIACGQGERALLLLPGAMGTAESSFDRITNTEDHFRVVSPSYPPLGTMAALTDGLAAVLDAEGIERTHVLGHSLGAGIAHALVRRHPERVDKLVLSGFGLYNEHNARLAKRYVRIFGLLPYGFVSGYYKRRMAKLLAGLDEGERAFMLAYMDDLLDRQLDKKALMAQFHVLEDMMDHPDVYGVYEPVERPGQVLILQAKDDTGFQPDEQAALRATYPGAEVHLFEEGGHLANVTQREDADQVIYRFLDAGAGDAGA